MIDAAAIARCQEQTKRARDQFLTLIKKIENLEPIFKKFRAEYSEIVSQNFAAKGKIMERERWRQYTPAYLKWKQKNYSGKPMLEITGALKKAAINFEAKISKKKMVMTVKGDPYMFYVSDRDTYGRKYFYTKEKGMPIQAWRILIEIVKKELEVEGKIEGV